MKKKHVKEEKKTFTKLASLDRELDTLVASCHKDTQFNMTNMLIHNSQFLLLKDWETQLLSSLVFTDKPCLAEKTS